MIRLPTLPRPSPKRKSEPAAESDIVTMDVMGRSHKVVMRATPGQRQQAYSGDHELLVEGDSRHHALANLHLAVRYLLHIESRRRSS